MDISVCIVNLNSIKFLRRCLESLKKGIRDNSFEVIIVDNNSKDGSISYLENFSEFKIKLIKNKFNSGYTKAINQALKKSSGEHILVLNPDSILQDKSIDKILMHSRRNKKIGVIGPKVVDESGNFQASCRRGIATPMAVFSYFTGLAKLFPKTEVFTGYQLNHLDNNVVSEVSGVSGSCMVIKSELIREIGMFDEKFFAYQEDSDFCLRAIYHGWTICFFPLVKVVHFGGFGGSNFVPMKAIFEWHRSYWTFYNKHFSKNYPFIFNQFYTIVMILKLIFSEIKYLIKN